MRTEEEMTQIAKDIWSGKIFTSSHITEKSIIYQVFQSLIFLSPEAIDDLKARDVQLFFEYLSEAGPRAINGYPIFLSCSFLTGEELKFVNNKYQEIVKVMGEI